MAKRANDLLAVARAELGTGERADGSTKYGSWYVRAKPAPTAFAAAAWCQMFTAWCANQIGLGEDVFPRMAYTPYARAWFRERGQWGSKPRVGALVYFNFPGGDLVDHVEIVEAVRTDGAIVTIGGNVANAVRRQVRRANIAGFGYPLYGTDTAKTWTEELMEQLPLIRQGSTGWAVKRAFYLLLSHGYTLDPKALDTTVYTGAMRSVVVEFQKAKGLEPDGIIGPKTWPLLVLP
ncbi:hypothetical protein Aph01nite_13000 [Acrocarpospora phusangensis]|uniref:CHAP domain-containing protein n=1 Tax=Acrocarpospora phusangensis TaxID=1070424 RepID=A0A919QA95_9ACTN|nr:CHAP domain-containing protein [Acrocarpospora phusangensis]GIH22990.1 hypothetical protein Aph01nite_13000 [Acrocarpospora phusangensis]